MDKSQVETTMAGLLDQALTETKLELQQDSAALAAFAANQAVRLSAMIDQPGFELMVQAERDIFALHAGITAHNAARKADSRLLGIVQGSIAMAARALATAALA